MTSISKRAIAARPISVEWGINRVEQEQLIKDARLARALVQEGLDLVDEAFERVGRRHAS